MMVKKFNVLSSCAFAATVVLFATLTGGCDQRVDPSLEAVYPAEGNAFMHDPEFRAKLDGQVRGRDMIVKERRELNAAMAALVSRHGGDRAAAEASDEGVALLASIRATDEKIISNRTETARLTRERMQRATEDSARIRRGEAKAIEISKKKEEVK